MRCYNKKTFMPRWLLPFLIGGAVLVIGTAVFLGTSRSESYATAIVTRGPLTEEVFASGKVESLAASTFRFKASGKLQRVLVRVGEQVHAGDVLAEQDTSVLDAELARSTAAAAAAAAQLQAAQNGTRPEELEVARAAVAKDTAALTQATASVSDALLSAYTVADNAVRNAADPLFTNPHTSDPRVLLLLPDALLKEQLESERKGVEAALTAWSLTTRNSSAVSALLLAQAQMALQSVSSLLADANAALTVAVPGPGVASSDLATWTTSVATARTNVTAAATALTAAVTVQKNAASALVSSQKNLSLLEAGSPATTLAEAQANLAASRASIAAVSAELQDLRIVAPYAGTVTEVIRARGGVVTPNDAIISLMPQTPLEVTLNISEDSVIAVHEGDRARITLDAYPRGISFNGVVRSIDPAETVIGGAVYYQAHVFFDETIADLRSGMTAHAWIETGSSTSTLYVPASALTRIGATTTVNVLEKGKPVSRVVSTGLMSQDGRVEILSGLLEGERVILEPLATLPGAL